MNNKTRELLSRDDRSELKGEVSREFGVISKTPKRFYQQKPKSVAQICCRLSPQCTETTQECLWPQMDWVRMDCGLKTVRVTVFKFSSFRFQNTLEH